jgi:ferritin-like metal-binding protein YciE
MVNKDIKTMDSLFVHNLQEIYCAEHQIKKSPLDMVDQATSPELKQGFQSHLQQTDWHFARLMQGFQQLGAKAKAVTCSAIDGLLSKASDIAPMSMTSRSSIPL